MAYTKKDGTFRSADNSCDVAYYIFVPDRNPKAVLQICHGMCEYIERYEREGFVEDMTSRGYVVCGCDHVGHGHTAPDPSELGYFADYRTLADNQKLMLELTRKTYRSLPYIIFGHSMGSFVARDYIARFGSTVDGAVICGTSGTNKQLGFGLFMTSLLEKLRGSHYRSNLVAGLSNLHRNDSWRDEHDTCSWLNDDKENRERYHNDPFSSFRFTVRAYNQMLKMLKYISSPEWYEAVPKRLPVFIMSGALDPLGENGKGVQEVFDKLTDMELSELKMELYENGRHELLNCKIRDNVIADLDKWADEIIEGVREQNMLGDDVFRRFM